ncbi:MAG: outer membrane protein assembly factor BamA [Gammaproteobacteria bacterium]|jgi:outer membrane protein insertion porin family|nr:outer membrane protein assembly factor BamA [Gammaproteobacteria bacterium]
MKNRWLVALAVLASHCAISAHALESFVVKDIRIEGLQRITEGTVLNYLPIHVGEELSESRTSDALKALFETGFFQDIQLERDNNVLVIKVTERPTIGKIVVSGNKDIPTDSLMSTLKSAGLTEGYVFDRSILEQVRNELERLYFSHGKYAVKVETTVEQQKHNRVNLSITIDEGQAARIKAINIVGNRKFSTPDLLSTFTLAPSNPLSWITKSDQYDKQKLGADLETLRTHYLDRGYLNFRIISTQVSITPDKQDIFITINLEEGEQFTLGGFQLSGDTILSEQELMPIIKLEVGEVFSRAKVAAIVKALTDRLGQEGYAFAKVNPVPEIQEGDLKVRLTFYVEPGNRIYVRRVLFEGNTKTKDEVVRREIIQMESAPVNTKNVEDSRARLNRTGYFTEVKVDLRPVAGTTDQVDVLYTLEEASAGQLGGGVGYSDVDGLLFNANISNRNFMGTGKSIDLSFNNSRAYTTYSMAYNNPYYTIDGMSRGFNLFYSKTDLGKSTSITSYTTDAFGANVSYGLPMSPVDRLTFGYGFQSTELKVGNSVPLEISNFVNTNGNQSNEVTLAAGWIHNTFDRYVFPENGLQQAAGFTISVPGSDLQYCRLTYNLQWYRSLGYGFIFTTGGTLGYGTGYEKTESLPFYKNFFAGGSRTVRGYEESSLGPRDSLNNPFGGNFLVTATTGLVLPNLIAPETRAVRLSWFVDGGQVYDLQNTTSLVNPLLSRNPTGLRFSTGLSLTWMSPIAPLVFSLATPLNEHDGDKIQKFSFTFGTVY